jgi:hypothetical protein
MKKLMIAMMVMVIALIGITGCKNNPTVPDTTDEAKLIYNGITYSIGDGKIDTMTGNYIVNITNVIGSNINLTFPGNYIKVTFKYYPDYNNATICNLNGITYEEHLVSLVDNTVVFDTFSGGNINLFQIEIGYISSLTTDVPIIKTIEIY